MQSDITSHKETESEINISRYPLLHVYSLAVDVLLHNLFHIHFWLQILTILVNRETTFQKFSAGAAIHFIGI
jgi:hypothetical protein